MDGVMRPMTWDELVEETKRLKKLVKYAFEEGWNHSYRDLSTVKKDWDKSTSKQDLNGPRIKIYLDGHRLK